MKSLQGMFTNRWRLCILGICILIFFRSDNTSIQNTTMSSGTDVSRPSSPVGSAAHSERTSDINCDSDIERSPPSSQPVANIESPPTSPLERRRSTDIECSPPSSQPEVTVESPPTSPLKRKRRKRGWISRGSLQRRRMEAETDTDSESASEVEAAGYVRIDHNQELVRGQSNNTMDENLNNAFDSSSVSNCSEDSSDNEDSIASILSASEMSAPSDLSANETSESEGRDSSRDSVASIEYLYEGSEIESKEALYDILKLYVEEKWSKTSLDKNLKLMKRLLPQPNDIPSSSKVALKQLEELTASFQEQEHSYCCNCAQLAENESNDENICECDSFSKFYTFPIEDQIKHMFEQRDLASLIDYHSENHGRVAGYICDIQDGSEYQKVKVNLKGKYDLVLLWNTDGVSLSKSSKQELWPLLCTICEIPPRLRSAFMIVGGVIVTEKKPGMKEISKPDMNIFLRPFVNSLQKINNGGGVSWVHPASKENYSSIVVAPVLCADAPARAAVLKTQGHNSRYGCNNCEQKSKKVRSIADNDNEEANNNPRRKRKKTKRCFLFQDDVAPARLRSGDRMDLQGEVAEQRGKPRKGVVSKAVISDIPFLDRGRCTCAEYMHLLLLGVCKYFLKLIFFQKGPWFIGDKLNEIDDFLSKIKVPYYIKRLPRGISDFKHWKASELRSFLLFYSLPLFKEFLPKEYFQHWLLFAGAVHILLKEAISEDDLLGAKIMIRSFVRDVAHLYGEKYYTYNLHTLLHIDLLVRRWGPLALTSAFPFENFNGFIAKLIHGTKNTGKEFINNVKISQRVAVLHNIVKAPPLGFPRSPLPQGIHLLGRPVDLQTYNLQETEMGVICNAGLGNFMVYHRVRVKSEIFTTKLYDVNKKRANSYVQFHSDSGVVPFEYGEIVVIVRAEDTSVYCLLHVFKIVHTKLLFHEESRFTVKNLLPVEYSEKNIMMPVDRISTKVLNICGYLGISPNSFEINL